MYKDNYPRIFSPQMETIVFIILQILFATRTIFKMWRWLAVDIYTLATDTEVNSCFSIYQNSEIIYTTKN